MNLYKVSIPSESEPLSFTMGYGATKNNTQNNTYQVIKMLLSSRHNH